MNEERDGSVTMNPRTDRYARFALFAYAAKMEQEEGSTAETQRLKDIAGRMGVPPEQFATYAVPFLVDTTRHGVLFTLFPPVSLRGASKEDIEHAVFNSGERILQIIVDELYRSYTDEPIDQAAARAAGESMLRHADALRDRNQR